DVDDDGQETAKTARDRARLFLRRVACVGADVVGQAYAGDRVGLVERRFARGLGAGRVAFRAHDSSFAASAAGPPCAFKSSSVRRTPKPVISVGTCASPPLCCAALRSRCTHGMSSGTKRF